MDEKYDVVVLGTGLKECILSSLMSLEEKKVLHIDRNNYYGGEITSLSPIDVLFKKFGLEKDLSIYQRSRDWNVDLISKFLMADGKLVKLLVHTGVTRYLEFRSIEGSYVYKDGKLHKVPSNEAEALSSKLMDIFKMRRFRKFLVWAMHVESSDPSSWNNVYNQPDGIFKPSIMQAFKHFDIDEDAQNFVGHAICLYQDDSYKNNRPAIEVINRMQLYSMSVCRFGKSPYLYPLYGLGELPQAFARLSAVYGGTYMLDTPVDEIVMENGKVVGVKSGAQIVRCDMVICDPSYASGRVKKVGEVVRAICLLKHPVEDVHGAPSTQIIIPQTELGRKNDIYVSVVSHTHNVCPENFFVAHVATIVETSSPKEELKPGLNLLGQIEEVFYSTQELWDPIDSGKESKVFVSSSYDASTHFESTCADVLDLYERITGHPFDFSKIKKPEVD